MKKHRSGTEPQEVPFPGDSGFMVTNKHPFVNVREERARGDQAYPA